MRLRQTISLKKNVLRCSSAFLHENVWPVADMIQYDGRIACAWSYSVWTWRHGGRRRFAKRIREAAQAELREADYAAYDLRPIRCLVGDDGSRFCRLL